MVVECRPQTLEEIPTLLTTLLIGALSDLSPKVRQYPARGRGRCGVDILKMEMILVEILRGQTLHTVPQSGSLLAGLANPLTARAITAMHADVAHRWTVGSLARHCGVSRSTLAAHFRGVMGIGPIEYLQRWRMALAKDQLKSGTLGVGEIALSIGFQSSSAFTTAFTRIFGCPPTQFVRGVR